jgi:hypothetical protein
MVQPRPVKGMEAAARLPREVAAMKEGLLWRPVVAERPQRAVA